MGDSPASKFVKEMSETRAYPLNAVNTPIFDEFETIFGVSAENIGHEKAVKYTMLSLRSALLSAQSKSL